MSSKIMPKSDITRCSKTDTIQIDKSKESNKGIKTIKIKQQHLRNLSPSTKSHLCKSWVATTKRQDSLKLKR